MTGRVAAAVIGAALFAAVPLAAQSTASQSVTLGEALTRSGVVSPSLISARGAVRTSELAIRTAKWGFIPTFSVRPRADIATSTGRPRLDPVTQELISGTTTTTSFGLDLTGQINLFDGFRRNHSLRQAYLREDASEARLIAADFTNILSTTNAFFDALANQQRVRVSDAAVERAEQQLRVSSARMQSGVGQLTDSLTAMVTLSQTRMARLTARANLEIAEANLGRIVGTDGRVAATDDSSFYAPPRMIDTSAIRSETMANAPSLISARADLEATKIQRRITRSEYWPTLSVSASSNWNANNQEDFVIVPRRSMTVGLSFNPWTSLNRETNLENQLIQIENAEAALADQERQVSAQLTQYFSALSNAQEQINVASQSVVAAEENLRVTTQRYELGVATILEQMQVQEQLSNAQNAEIDARFQYLRAKVQIEALIGRKL